jgi:hypothetical protein
VNGRYEIRALGWVSMTGLAKTTTVQNFSCRRREVQFCTFTYCEGKSPESLPSGPCAQNPLSPASRNPISFQCSAVLDFKRSSLCSRRAYTEAAPSFRSLGESKRLSQSCDRKRRCQGNIDPLDAPNPTTSLNPATSLPRVPARPPQSNLPVSAW